MFIHESARIREPTADVDGAPEDDCLVAGDVLDPADAPNVGLETA